LYTKCLKPSFVKLLSEGTDAADFPEDILELLKTMRDDLSPSRIVSAVPVQASSSMTVSQNHAITLLDDAILGMTRIMPERNIFVGRTLFVRDVESFNLILMKPMWEKVREYFDHYDVKTVGINETVALYILSPVKYYIDLSIIRKLYAHDNPDQFTIYDLLHSVDCTTDYMSHYTAGDYRRTALLLDRNYGPIAIYNRIIGSTITSVDFGLDLLRIAACKILFPKEMSLVDKRKKFDSRFNGYNITLFSDLVTPQILSKTILTAQVPIRTLQHVFAQVLTELHYVKLSISQFGCYPLEIQQLLECQSVGIEGVVMDETNEEFSRPRPSAPNMEPEKPSRLSSFNYKK